MTVDAAVKDGTFCHSLPGPLRQSDLYLLFVRTNLSLRNTHTHTHMQQLAGVEAGALKTKLR